jgi:hypothetical protein
MRHAAKQPMLNGSRRNREARTSGNSTDYYTQGSLQFSEMPWGIYLSERLLSLRYLG